MPLLRIASPCPCRALPRLTLPMRYFASLRLRSAQPCSASAVLLHTELHSAFAVLKCARPSFALALTNGAQLCHDGASRHLAFALQRFASPLPRCALPSLALPCIAIASPRPTLPMRCCAKPCHARAKPCIAVPCLRLTALYTAFALQDGAEQCHCLEARQEPCIRTCLCHCCATDQYRDTCRNRAIREPSVLNHL